MSKLIQRCVVRAITPDLRVIDREGAEKAIRRFLKNSLSGIRSNGQPKKDDLPFRVESFGCCVYEAYVAKATVYGPLLIEAELVGETKDGEGPVQLGTVQLISLEERDDAADYAVDYDDLPPEPFQESQSTPPWTSLRSGHRLLVDWEEQPGDVPDDTTGAAARE